MSSIVSKTEAWVESYLVEQCAAYGALVIKVQHVRSWPDRIVFWFDGCCDLIELKRPKGGKFEPNQERTHGKLRQRGHSVFVLNTRDQVDAYIRVRRAYWNAFRQAK